MTALDSLTDPRPTRHTARSALALATFLLPPLLWLALLVMTFTGCMPVAEAQAAEREVRLPQDAEWQAPASSNPLPWDEGEEVGSTAPSFLNPPDVRPPPRFLRAESCPSDHGLRLDDTLVVTSWSRNQDTGVLVAREAGWFWLYGGLPADSGSAQWNESAWARVSNPSNPDGGSLQTNCGEEWLVRDSDNRGAPGERVYLGLFWLDQGPNAISLHHACPSIRAGVCATFEDSSSLASSCTSWNANSVSLRGEELCGVGVQAVSEEDSVQASLD